MKKTILPSYKHFPLIFTSFLKIVKTIKIRVKRVIHNGFDFANSNKDYGGYVENSNF